MINIAAFFSPLVLFSFWSLLGCATLALLDSKKDPLLNLLISPVLGVAILALLTFLINRWNWPVKNFANIETVILTIMALLIILYKKSNFFSRSYIPFALVLVLALFLVGRPLALYGLNWLSFANGDAGFYCLGATHLLNHGFSELPNVKALNQGTDYSVSWWFTYTSFMHRYGGELLIAWLSQLTQLSPFKIFMPIIVALNLSLISAISAFIYQTSNSKKLAVITAILVSCSPLTTLGVLSQLLPQVAGSALLVVACVFILQPFEIDKLSLALKQSIPVALIVSALAIIYPELLPFLILSVIFYFGALLLKGWRANRSFFWMLAFVIVLLIILLNTYWLYVMRFTVDTALSQVTHNKLISTLNSVQAEALDFGALFPYFLLPSAFANFWGLQPIALLPKEPWVSLTIFTGIILSLLTLGVTLTLIRKSIAPAFVTLIMFLLGIQLFLNNSGFGLYKLAMYIQPFLLGSLTIGLFLLVKSEKKLMLVLIPFVSTNLYIQGMYVQDSLGSVGSSFAELPNATKSKLLDEVHELAQSLPPSATIAVDTTSIMTANILTAHLRGKELHFYSVYSENDGLRVNIENEVLELFFPQTFATSVRLRHEIKPIPFNRGTFNLYDKSHNNLSNKFFLPLVPFEKNQWLIISTNQREIFNNRKFPENYSKNFVVMPRKDAKDYLIFKSSALGSYFTDYFLLLKQVGLNAIEKDFFYPGPLAGIGRYLLFYIVNPSPNSYLELSFTESLMADGANVIPAVSVIGSQRSSFPVMGRGSARVFSPFKPQLINNNSYLMIDIGKDGKKFPTGYTGLMKLWAKRSMDSRMITGFLRDISVVSRQDFLSLHPPTHIQKFPQDLLGNKDLEYSGIYEDGWISEDSFFKLVQEGNTHLRIKGSLASSPLVPNRLTILVDDKILAVQNLDKEHFNVVIPIPYKAGRRKVELHFAKVNKPSGADRRPTSAFIEFLGFEKV